jgi:hypothetical protein
MEYTFEDGLEQIVTAAVWMLDLEEREQELLFPIVIFVDGFRITFQPLTMRRHYRDFVVSGTSSTNLSRIVYISFNLQDGGEEVTLSDFRVVFEHYPPTESH